MASRINELLGIPRNKEIKTILVPRNPRRTQQSTDKMADYLAQKFNSPEYLPLFRKVAWRLSDSTISRLVGVSLDSGANNPRAYFIACVKREEEYYGK